MHDAELVIGLGANLGEPLVAFCQAIEGMRGWLERGAVSALYQTQAIGPEQPDFLNAAIRGRTRLAPEQILDRLLDLEQQAGRVRRERWGPRTLDLDLLWLDGVTLDGPRLVLPHPRLTERAFALLPLLDVAPDARDPRSQRPYREWLPEVRGQRVARRSEAWLPGL